MDECFVYLPVYNGEKYLRKTIESVLAQDYPSFKIIIYDDCSTDSSPSIIEEYMRSNPQKIIFEKNEHNLGVGTTLHKCYEKYHDAHYFAQIGHDDMWPENYLSSQISTLSKWSNALVSFADVNYIDGRGKSSGDLAIFDQKLIDSLDRERLFLRILENNFLCAPASVVDISKLNAEEANTYWGYNNERLQDCELWLNLSMRGGFAYNHETKIYYRVHGQNLSDVTKRVLQGRLEYYTMVERILFSEQFFNFLSNSTNPSTFIDGLIETLARNVPYSNPLKLTIINMCEQLLNRGYETDTIWVFLNWLYMDTGIIGKCLKNNKKLTAKIEVTLGGMIRAAKTVRALEKSGNFIIHEDLNTLSMRSICITQESNLEYLFNLPEFNSVYLNGQVIVLCRDSTLKETQKKYPFVKCVADSISTKEMETMLYSFVEDKTHIYRNGFFDMLTGYGYPDMGYKTVYIEMEEKTSVRAIAFLDQENRIISAKTQKESLQIIQSDTSVVLFEDNVVDCGCLELQCDNDVYLKNRIVVNNIVYICNEVRKCENNIIVPVFRPLSYFNFSFSMDKYTALQTDYANLTIQLASVNSTISEITSSMSYRYCIKIKELLYKFRLLKPIKAVLVKSGMMTRVKRFFETSGRGKA